MCTLTVKQNFFDFFFFNSWSIKSVRRYAIYRNKMDGISVPPVVSNVSIVDFDFPPNKFLEEFQTFVKVGSTK